MILNQEHIDSIKDLKPMEEGFEYKTSAWQLLKEEHKELIQEFEGKEVNRGAIIQAYKNYYNKEVDVLKPFLLTMIWGYSDTGYGNYRTNKYLVSKEGIDQTGSIKSAIDLAQAYKIKEAYKTLNQIKGLSISFISKVLYFATKAADANKEYALVFDVRVASSLIELTTPKEVFEIVSVYPSSKYDDYEKYNTLIHQLARTNHLEADAIELFLFEQKNF